MYFLQGREKNVERAAAYLAIAAEDGDAPVVEAMYVLGLLYDGQLSGLAHTTAHSPTRLAAARARAAAARRAVHARDGDCDAGDEAPDAAAGALDFAVDHARALSLFARAAEHGHTEARYRTASAILGDERAGEDDWRLAVAYLETATAAGHGPSFFRLGRCAADGIGIAQDLTLAASLFRRADEMNAGGSARQLFAIGMDFLTRRDERKAIEYFTMGADVGDAKCALHLGQIYATGNVDVENHRETAPAAGNRRSLGRQLARTLALADRGWAEGAASPRATPPGQGLSVRTASPVAPPSPVVTAQSDGALTMVDTPTARGITRRLERNHAASQPRMGPWTVPKVALDRADPRRAMHDPRRVAMDVNLATRFFRQAADAGLVEAQYHAGALLLPSADGEAYLHAAAEGGHAPAALVLADQAAALDGAYAATRDTVAALIVAMAAAAQAAFEAEDYERAFALTAPLDAFGHAGAENLRRRLITGHYVALPGSALAWLTFWHTCSGNTRYESDRQADATFAADCLGRSVVWDGTVVRVFNDKVNVKMTPGRPGAGYDLRLELVPPDEADVRPGAKMRFSGVIDARGTPSRADKLVAARLIEAAPLTDKDLVRDEGNR